MSKFKSSFSWLNNLKSKLVKSQLGIAVDEGVLITVMVTSLGAFVAVNIPWGEMNNNSEKILNELSLIQEANQNFFDIYRMWPHEVTDGDWKDNISALHSNKVMRYPFNSMTSSKNLIPKLDLIDQDDSYEMHHSFGKGGVVSQRPVRYKNDDYMEIVLDRVPLVEARRLDKKVDGKYDPNVGKVYFVFDGEDRKLVNLHYRANKL